MISAPNKTGFCKTGLAKILSTTVLILYFFAILQTALISINSKSGFEGVSKKKIFVFFLIAFFHSFMFFPSTNVTSTPYLGRIFFIISFYLD